MPLSDCNRGFGSKVSTCEGPPGMKRKMTRLARAGKCGARLARAASEIPVFPKDAAAPVSARASAINPARATVPNPPPITRNIWRRLRPPLQGPSRKGLGESRGEFTFTGQSI